MEQDAFTNALMATGAQLIVAAAFVGILAVLVMAFTPHN